MNGKSGELLTTIDARDANSPAIRAVQCLPRDGALIPISGGALLVSRDHAVYCRVPAGESDANCVNSTGTCSQNV